MQQIILQEEEICLLPERALYWPIQKTLIVADLHWGKSAHFRKNGIAIPSTQKQDEVRLANLIQHYKAERLVIAGDLFHSKANNETDGFNNWRAAHNSLHIDLVSGNHDILPDETYTSCNIALHKEYLDFAPFHISHDATDEAEHFVLHGHIHPALRMSGSGRQSVKLPCFAQTKNSMILPAFGQFTGTHAVEETQCRHIYVIADGNIMQWK